MTGRSGLIQWLVLVAVGLWVGWTLRSDFERRRALLGRAASLMPLSPPNRYESRRSLADPDDHMPSPLHLGTYRLAREMRRAPQRPDGEGPDSGPWGTRRDALP